MSTTIEILIDGYNDDSCKRQPWYTVRVLKQALENLPETNVFIRDRVINNEADVRIICTSLFRRNPSRKHPVELTLEIFPFLTLEEIMRLTGASICQNWSPLYKLLIAYFLPRQESRSRRIFISPRMGLDKNNIFFPPVNLSEFKPSNLKLERMPGSIKHIGYLGPPYESRHYSDVLCLLSKFLRKNSDWRGKVLTRIERAPLEAMQTNAYRKVNPPESLEFITGMLSRDRFLAELSIIDVLVLPFNFVMSEMPIVVYESLLSGKPIVITKNVLPNLETIPNESIFIVDNFRNIRYREFEKFVINSKHFDPRPIYHEIVQQKEIFLNKISNIINEKNKGYFW
jgi:glycosyltransferase involved in cell wall biosynthesis